MVAKGDTAPAASRPGRKRNLGCLEDGLLYTAVVLGRALCYGQRGQAAHSHPDTCWLSTPELRRDHLRMRRVVPPASQAWPR